MWLWLLLSLGCRPAPNSPSMDPHALRLSPGADLKSSLQTYAREQQLQAGVILTCVGSLTDVHLRLANQEEGTRYRGHYEIVSLVGTLTAEGMHLHLSLADSSGATFGGHLLEGCRVYTTAEIALAELPGYRFTREPDPQTGYRELRVSSRPAQ